MSLTFGPESPHDDELVIAKGYQPIIGPALAAVPICMAAYGLDLKWVITISLAILVMLLHEAGGRLHDLCIRLRRTNATLSRMQRAGGEYDG
jgi:hypothetical protein